MNCNNNLKEFINGLDSNQLLKFIILFNKFYEDTKSIKSKYINDLTTNISSECLSKLNEEDKKVLKANNIDVIGGMPLKLMKWWHQ